jgi:hypothetical protein
MGKVGLRLARIVMVALVLSFPIATTAMVSWYGGVEPMAFVIGILGIQFTILIPLFIEWLKQPELDILAGTRTDFIINNNTYRILHLIVRNQALGLLSRNFAVGTRAIVRFMENGNTLTSTSGKWADQPEPVLQLPQSLGGNQFQGWLTAFLRAVDIPPGGDAPLAIAIKRDGDPYFYGFDAWSYASSLLRPNLLVQRQGRVRVLVTVQSGDVSKSRNFTLNNVSNSVRDFVLE